MLAAHYDSVPTGPGATDNGSGVATALETLRALKAAPPLRNDVIFLFTDGEERGLLGARAFVEQHPWAGDVGVVLNLDTRGNTGPALMLKTNDEGGWVIEEFAKATPYPMTTSDSVAFFKRSRILDLSVFLDAVGLDFRSPPPYGSRTTTSRPTARGLDNGACASGALPLPYPAFRLVQPRADQGPRFCLLNLSGSSSTPAAWSIPLAVFALLLGGGSLLGLRRGRLRPGGLALGFVVLPAAMAAAALVAHLSWTVILAIHPGGIWALEYRPAIIWIGMASLTVAITATVYAALRNRIRAFELAVGGLLCGLLLAARRVWPAAGHLPFTCRRVQPLGLGSCSPARAGQPLLAAFTVPCHRHPGLPSSSPLGVASRLPATPAAVRVPLFAAASLMRGC